MIELFEIGAGLGRSAAGSARTEGANFALRHAPGQQTADEVQLLRGEIDH